MSEFERQERMKSLQAIEDMLKRSEMAKEKFLLGTSQHSLLVNRIHALKIASSLLSCEITGADIASLYTKEELAFAQVPLTSLVSKCEKVRSKLSPTSWQSTKMKNDLDALILSATLLREKLTNI